MSNLIHEVIDFERSPSGWRPKRRRRRKRRKPQTAASKKIADCKRLVRLLSKRNPDKTRMFNDIFDAIFQLGELKEKCAVKPLIDILRDKHFAVTVFKALGRKEFIKRRAAVALGKIGGLDALLTLWGLLNKPEDDWNSRNAVQGLKHMKGRKVVFVLLSRIIRGPRKIKLSFISSIIQALFVVDPHATSLAKIVKKSKRRRKKKLIRNLIRGIFYFELKGNPSLITYLMEAFGKIKDRILALELAKTLRSFTPQTMIKAMNALGKIGNSVAVFWLNALLKFHHTVMVRISSARALGRIGGKKALSKLRKRLKSKKEKDPRVIFAIRKALGLIPSP